MVYIKKTLKKNKTTMICHYRPNRMAKIKNNDKRQMPVKMQSNQIIHTLLVEL